ncbi:MAG TPA: class I SAM-dependent methyltransferase [Nitrospira sp.]|nr:class I SAM-dependent methyltransferase [Nitrospira sp.]
MSVDTTSRVFSEYLTHEAILKYTRSTAGYGVSYLLDHEYKAVYLWALDHLPQNLKRDGLRIMEFGCGGGMNLIQLISVLNQNSVRVERAIGTDFSSVLIDAANREARSYLQEQQRHQIEFHIAKHETLLDDLSVASGVSKQQVQNSQHFIVGVNTIRYSHHAGTELQTVQNLFDLLVPGGLCVIIDMNNGYPFFKSELKNKVRTQKRDECYLPSLEEYVSPFRELGFEVLRNEHFCWVPHSSGPLMCYTFSWLSPILNLVARSRAMRSLVVARKPETRA